MRKSLKKFIAVLIIIVMTLGMVPFSASASNATGLVAQINATAGLTAVHSPADPNVINVSGSANLNATYNLNIDPEVTVNWGATLIGNLTGSKYALVLSGEGTFNVPTNGLVRNDGTGGAVNMTGKGTINVNGGEVSSGGSGVTLNVASEGTTVNVTANGTVTNKGGAGSAISVTVGVTGVEINVDGGMVLSTPGGYAINDGGTQTSSNNTKINITGGSTIEAVSACAIRSTGTGAVVTVMDSTVRNDATSNANPTIYMNCDPTLNYGFNNVEIGGTSVITTLNTANTSYVIQTTGNVKIQDDAQVIAINGRAINLVGENSTATIEGGAVRATGSGVAISTATTPGVDVTKAGVIVNGGTVSSTSGNAIHLTGAESYAEINGGWVSATSGNAINVAGTGTSAKVEVKGDAWVSATIGRAINVIGTATGATVTVDGGFVFAYGVGLGDVVRAPATFTGPIGDGVVVAWDTETGTGTYREADDEDLYIRPTPPPKVVWHTTGVANGIYYANGENIGFFPLGVDIIFDGPESAGLIYDVETKKFYLDALGTGTIELNPLYDGQRNAWKGDDSGILELDGFIWGTGAPIALRVINSAGGDASLTIVLTGTNRFATNNTGGGARGILSEDVSITIAGGGGELYAAAAGGIGIDARALIIDDGAVTAVGGNSAFRTGMMVTPAAASPKGHAYWTSPNADGSDAVQSASYIARYSNTGQQNTNYVRIQIITAHEVTVEGGTGGGHYFPGQSVVVSSGTTYLPGIIIQTMPLANYPLSRPVFTSWTTSSEGVAFANADSPATTFTMPDANVTVTANIATAYRLYVSGGYLNLGPGQPTNRVLGYYFAGAQVPLATHAAPAANYVFDAWQVVNRPDLDASFTDTISRNTVFTMPAAGVQVDARWVRVTSGPFTLTVEGGEGRVADGSPGGTVPGIMAGTSVTINADAPPEGYEFDHWKISVAAPSGRFQGSFANVKSVDTQFAMGEGDITIRAEYKRVKYSLSVIRGTSEDGYLHKLGAEVHIEAETIAGQTFVEWVCDDGVVNFANSNSEATIFNMPAQNVTVIAIYEDTLYTLAVVNGSDRTGQGPYKAGAEVTIEAETRGGEKFTGWTSVGGGQFDNPYSMTTTFIMPFNNATVTSLYEAIPSVTSPKLLTVVNGEGGGNFTMGTAVQIRADQAPAGREFSHWTTSGGGTFANATVPNTTFFMPDDDVTVTAHYVDVTYVLTVVNGRIAGDETRLPRRFPVGAPVAISADAAPEGMRFDRWVLTSGSGSFGRANSAATVFTMAGDAVVTALFRSATRGGGTDRPSDEPAPTPDPNGNGDGQGHQHGPEGSSDVSRLLNTERHIQFIQGVGGNRFEPERNMTRAEVAQMFFNLLLEQNVEITRRFPDEIAGAWHERAVHTLASLGIIEGYPDGAFHPDDSVTRAEFVAMAVRFAEALPEISQDSPFDDVHTEHWAYRYVYAAVQFGWVTGYGDGTFLPGRHISRAEAVTIVNRMLTRVADRSHIDEHQELGRFDDVPDAHWAFYDIMEAFNPHEYHWEEDGDEEVWDEDLEHTLGNNHGE